MISHKNLTTSKKLSVKILRNVISIVVINFYKSLRRQIGSFTILFRIIRHRVRELVYLEFGIKNR